MTKFEEKLKYILETIDIGNAMTEPLTESIRKVLEISSARLKADGSSVLVLDANTNDLYFLMATGKVADKITGMRIPAGRGIAGFVFSSGQQIAISDVSNEASFYDEIDKKTGYTTQIMLATPLRYDERIIGVLEYVNRVGEPPYMPFTSEEMDEAAIFAEIIASLVNTYESVKIFRNLGEKMISQEKIDISEIRDWLRSIRTSNEYREMIELAVLVKELSKQGEEERQLCKELLQLTLDYSKKKTLLF
ncbi:MAG: GAF domain-containing protein [Pyrinomonadaceae bacterium]|nr:GAF domain-containing protein [Pyrinomonadaceae bacterium]MCX7639093.1 GAF domain-containing protein [Pyrinomonadaceae bacterium]MDW8303686.1 GAF domain-containing protein [Acidobacteriota bacterium]